MFHCFQQLVLGSCFVYVLMGGEQVEHFSAALTLKCIPVVFSSQGLNTVLISCTSSFNNILVSKYQKWKMARFSNVSQEIWSV